MNDAVSAASPDDKAGQDEVSGAPSAPALGLSHGLAGELPELQARARPMPVPAPRLLAWNAPLARELGLAPALDDDPGLLAQLFSGALLPADARPVALAYAGHQFGHFVPQLGDGRALLLGERVLPDGRRFDLQLKGAGHTVFSRGGDGRAALGPVLREYLVSEVMAALGVPTTRALAAAATGEGVWRERPLPGAVLTRVAASHLRIGSFEYLAARGQVDALARLVDHALARHYPAQDGDQPPALRLLAAVADAQARLVAHWLAVGFVHGVMNTDNVAISGETLDYGPCAFMDAYHPDTVFSSIDRHGRYAWGRQPAIAHWNLGCLAMALRPLLDLEEDRNLDDAQAVLDGFPARIDALWQARLLGKLGLSPATASDSKPAGEGADPLHDSRAVVPEHDRALATDLLALMQAAGADWTASFRHLGQSLLEAPDWPGLRAQFDGHGDGLTAWLSRWHARLALDGIGPDVRAAAMHAVNPARIPRNHLVEAALAAAHDGDFAPFRRLQAALASPYDEAPAFADLAAPPPAPEQPYRTFCGT
ncbi:MAG: YdiU family protein [Xanthomonadales bacterium]|nr:YdiU family protein [Xanthomonadales bacterium]